ncbi:MAG TPA: cell division protein ZapE [Acetobacteraceae bacterium]|nr:cell division protein ZapE [Acetobacteraceae bacterium]
MHVPPANSAGPLAAYRALLAAGTLTADSSQYLAAERLQDLWQKLRGYDPPLRAPGFMLSRLLRMRPAEGAPDDRPNGLYLVGEVGRGKSMLMDLFFRHADVVRKRRIHFHAFMQEAHARIHGWKAANPDGTDPIPPLADAVATEAALLCFDEFQVNDIADAMILGRLFAALFERGVVVVATSNTLPQNLFRGRPGRDAFLPFIALLQQKLDVLVLEGDQDYRRRHMPMLPIWHVPADARAERALDEAFATFADGAEAGPRTLLVMGRRFRVPLAAGCVARFDFDALCGQPLGAGDYLALATHFEALVLDDIPRLSPDNFDEARRFITLVDALYEHRVKLVASAAAGPDALYRSGEGAQAFERTASRLIEMQGREYLELKHLT